VLRLNVKNIIIIECNKTDIRVACNNLYEQKLHKYSLSSSSVRNRHSSVGILARLRLTQPRNHALIPLKERDFSLF
jgi:hypothetical protein